MDEPSPSLSPPGSDLDGLVEELRAHVRYRYMPDACRRAMDRAAAAIRSLRKGSESAGLYTEAHERLDDMARESIARSQVAEALAAWVRKHNCDTPEQAERWHGKMIDRAEAAEVRISQLEAELKRRFEERSYLPALKAAGGWRAIESAPKDGAQVLLLGQYPTKCGWSDIYQAWWDKFLEDCEGAWARWPHNFSPTHWMPLPPAPGSLALGAVPEGGEERGSSRTDPSAANGRPESPSSAGGCADRHHLYIGKCPHCHARLPNR